MRQLSLEVIARKVIQQNQLSPSAFINYYFHTKHPFSGNNFLKLLTVTLSAPAEKGAFYQTSHEIHFTFLPLVCQKLYVAFNKLLQMSMLITKQHDISNSEEAENQKQLH